MMSYTIKQLEKYKASENKFAVQCYGCRVIQIPQQFIDCLQMDSDSSSVDDFDDVVLNKTKNKHWDRKLELINDLKKAVGTVQTGKKNLNVVVIGTTGCGKSSFINTALTSFRQDKWQLYSTVGKNSGNITNITQHFKSFRADKTYFKEDNKVLFPTFIDINGLEDDKDDFNRAFLRALFDGKIEEDEQLTTLLQMYQSNPNGFKKIMSRRIEYLKINRIIVVTSADPSEPLPNELFKCIKEVADDVKAIPIFGVMTKKDKFKRHEQIPKRIDDFIGNLGITEDSFKWIENYCPDVDKKMNYHMTVYPSIDVPVLKLITQVINPHLRSEDPMEERPGFLATIILKVVTMVSTLIQIVIWMFFLVGLIYVIYKDYRDCDMRPPNERRRCDGPATVIYTLLFITPIFVSLFLFVLPYIVKKLLRKDLQTWLSVISIVISLSTLVYIYKDQITHWFWTKVKV
ncbi:unnamed protein product [Mytilus coruscus]|uniref:Uncharacterized protein n=1 Tax=Mytilus coruscus TaxID=42192 RepID=A0A6J8A3A5_MYTCO|nr:unnamed protein product [Mytilus coruscus]